MIDNYYNQNISEIYEIEKKSFKNLWEKSQFLRYSMESDNSMSFIYRLKTKIVGYLMAKAILNEIHIHNVVVEKQHRNNNIAKK